MRTNNHKSNKLTDKSKDFLKRLYQEGGLAPIQSGYQLQKPVVSQTPINNNLDSNTQLYMQQMRNLPLYQPVQPTQAVPQEMGNTTDQALDIVGSFLPSVQIASAAINMAKSVRAKADQKRKRKWFNEDLEERQNDIRRNEYVNVPHSYTNYQLGGTNLDAISFGYENQKEMNRQSQQNWIDYYNGLNQQNINKWKELEQKGYTQAANATVGQLNTLSSVLQEGGEYDERKDIYSENFDKDVFLETTPNPLAERENVIRREEEDNLIDWIFEDEVDTYSPIQDQYENFNQPLDENTNSVIQGIGLSESGGDYGVVNSTTGTTGKYQFHPKYWADQIREFSGINGSTDQVMQEFRENPLLQESFMGHVVENIYKPEIRKLKPYMDKYGFNEEQMIRFMHYRGIEDTKRRLKSGDFNVSEEEKRKYQNPDILEYISR